MSSEPEPVSSDAIRDTLVFYRQTLEWLIAHHARFAAVSKHDLSADERANAMWKLSGESLSHAMALVALLELGYTAQAWPAMRAVHEANRLLIAVSDPEEERITGRWLADKEVKQAEARAAEQRQVQRIAEQMREAGVEPIDENVDQATRGIYKGMSRAAHHQRSVVDESVDHDARTFVYGPDPREDNRLAYTIYAGALIHEVLLIVGDSLGAMWGPAFYSEHLAPMLGRMEQTLKALDFYEFARRIGLV